MKSKAKHTEPLQTGPFLMLWIAAYIIGWLAAYILYELDNDFFSFGQLSHALLLTVVPGFFVTLMQSRLVAPHLAISKMHWITVSMIGWLCSAFTYFAFVVISVRDPNPNLQIAIMYGIPALVQWYSLLKNRLNSGWLWPLVSIVSALVFGTVMVAVEDIESESIALILGAVVQSIVTGAIMLWLLKQPRYLSEKAKLL